MSDSKYVVDGLTKHLPRWEARGFIGINNCPWFQATASWLRDRGALTTLRWVKGYDACAGNIGADHEAGRAAHADPDPSFTPTPLPKYATTGIQPSVLTQQLAYGALRDIIQRTYRLRRQSMIHLDMTRHGAEALSGSLLTDAAIWRAIHHCDYSPQTRIFLWKIIHGAHRNGAWCTQVSNYKHRAICAPCCTIDTMEHILLDCGAPGPATIWNTVRILRARTGHPWTPFIFGTLLAAPFAAFTKPDDQPDFGAQRLFRILLSEAARLIWQLRCERVIQHDGD
ncbi:hypothetical protein EIP86_008280 [Pleurotus ostreatoroseus]|nr:hypothetical protein EIP86_008280 [Pleurotus ostreatoroseus]